MEDLKIVGWTSFDSPYKTEKCSGDKLQAMLDLIFDEIAKNNYVFSGEEHQNELTGVPVFSDGTCFRASMRVWGGIMANMYSGADGEELTYMDFYMSLGSSAQLPAYAPIPIPPAEVAEESCHRAGHGLYDERQGFAEGICKAQGGKEITVAVRRRKLQKSRVFPAFLQFQPDV